MIGLRTRYSLAQLLELQTPQFVAVLLGKYGAHISLRHDQMLVDILNTVKALGQSSALELLSEVAATSGDLRKASQHVLNTPGQ
jgi:hypothetical protein